MASFTTILPECAFLEDLPDITLSGITSAVNVTVRFEGVTLVSRIKFTPNKQNQITIYAKQMIRNMVSFAKPHPQGFIAPLPTLHVLAQDGTAIYTTGCAVIPGGTNRLAAISEEWFAKNFLTWQPQIIYTTPTQPQWLSYIPSPPYEQIHITSKLYTKEGRALTKTIDTVTSDSTFFFRQICTDFSTIWGNECITQNLTPVCYDVYGLGYMDGNTTSQKNLPMPQRYMLRPKRYNDVCFGFENTLGGFDTLMLEGKTAYLPEGDTTSFRGIATEKELVNDYTSIWEANTGRIETEREANQYQDFLKSTNRYVLSEGVWRQIVVTEHKVKHYPGESNSYTFKYHLAEKNEGRFFERQALPEPDYLPDEFFPEKG